MTAVQLEICSTAAASVPCMSDLRIEASPAPGKENKQVAEQVVLRSRVQQGGASETPAPVFNFFGGEEEEQPEIHVVEDQTVLPSAAPSVDRETPQDFLDSITEEVKSDETEMKINFLELIVLKCADANITIMTKF